MKATITLDKKVNVIAELVGGMCSVQSFIQKDFSEQAAKYDAITLNSSSIKPNDYSKFVDILLRLGFTKSNTEWNTNRVINHLGKDITLLNIRENFLN